MDRKISLYIVIPSLAKSINFLVPESMTVGTAKKLILRNLEKKGTLDYKNENVKLIFCSTGYALDDSRRIIDVGISDGSKLILCSQA